MSDKVPFDGYEPEGQLDKLLKKTKDNPLVPIGLAGFAGVVAFGAYNYKNRGTMATSMYLMQLRVAAQGTVVGIISIGLFYQIYTRLNHMWFAEDQSKTSTNKKDASH